MFVCVFVEPPSVASTMDSGHYGNMSSVNSQGDYMDTSQAQQQGAMGPPITGGCGYSCPSML